MKATRNLATCLCLLAVFALLSSCRHSILDPESKCPVPVKVDGKYGYVNKKDYNRVDYIEREKDLEKIKAMAIQEEKLLRGYSDHDVLENIESIEFAISDKVPSIGVWYPEWDNFPEKSISDLNEAIRRWAYGSEVDFIIKPQFDEAYNFSEGLARIKINGKYGYIDKKGNYVINMPFDEAEDFSKGLARIKINEKYGYIDKKGNFVIKPQFDEVHNFSEGLARVKIDDKYGYIDKKGNIVIKPQFDYADDFSEGLAMVETGGIHGHIDKKGNFQFD